LKVDDVCVIPVDAHTQPEGQLDQMLGTILTLTICPHLLEEANAVISIDPNVLATIAQSNLLIMQLLSKQ